MNNPVEIEHDIARELANTPTLNNSHGISLDNIANYRVVPPQFGVFDDACDNTGELSLDAWIVLDECPDSNSQGYLIVYVPEEQMYGLAIKCDPNPVFIGCYGTFLDTIVAM